MKRNAKGNGSIRQRSDGTWEARCTINGKRRSFYGEKQADVLKEMRNAQKNCDDGIFFEPTRITYGQWLDVWLEEYVKTSNKYSTYETYNQRIQSRIKPALAKIKLTVLNPTHLQSFYNDLLNKAELQPKTIKNIHGIIHKSLTQALKLRYIGYNPADACTLPRIEKKEMHPLTEDEMRAFIEKAREGEPLGNMFIVALFTGMRKGEICGLSWKAVDFKRGTISVSQQLCREKKKGGQHYIDRPKNNKGRVITVAPFVLDILKEVRKEQMINKMHLGSAWKNEWDLVFTNGEGRYITPQTAYKRFKAIAEKIGRADARFHDLRHTYATNSIQEGDDLKTVQHNLGHATASFTLDVYGHVSEKMKNESANRAQALFDRINA